MIGLAKSNLAGATGLSVLSKTRVSKHAVEVCPDIFNIIAISKVGRETQIPDRESTDVVSEALKT